MPIGNRAFVFLYIFVIIPVILRPNNQNKPGPVEHHWFEGRGHHFVYLKNIFNQRENFRLFLKLLIGRTQRQIFIFFAFHSEISEIMPAT